MNDESADYAIFDNWYDPERHDKAQLQIAGLNVDLEGIGRLKQMLAKYEEIIKLQQGEK